MFIYCVFTVFTSTHVQFELVLTYHFQGPETNFFFFVSGQNSEIQMDRRVKFCENFFAVAVCEKGTKDATSLVNFISSCSQNM